MSGLFRATAMRVAFTTALVMLGTGGFVAGVAAASGAVPPPPVDHQLCYTASARGFRIPAGVVLRNQFSPRGFKPKISTMVFHCNPVKKTLLSGKVFPITNANAHLACFKITAATQPTRRVVVSNQFGKAVLVTGQPDLLCLPSWKSLTGPPHKRRPQPPGLNHFTCYPVKLMPGSSYHPPPVLLQDEFAQKPVSAQVNPVPVQLCLPTQKTVGRHVYKIINAAQHLLCFPVSPTPVVPKVFDQNQFGTATVAIRQTTTLCLPSLKRIVG